MLVLYENASGYFLFKMLTDKCMKESDKISTYFDSAEKTSQILQLAEFHKFHDSAEALQAAISLNEGSMTKSLKALIKKASKKQIADTLMVIDPKLGQSIKSKFSDLNIVSDIKVNELVRCIRGQMESLIPGISEKESSAMMLGLGHNMSRYKVKFSPDKIDTMVIQAVSLLEDLDKELNNYNMRAKEWYGWHFPELAKILTDNLSYILTINKMGFRMNAKDMEFSDILTKELEEKVKSAAEVSMGCEISDMDLESMRGLCQQIIDLTEYRKELTTYLEARLASLCPNLDKLMGCNIAAKLVAHAGSLMNLAKTPASTIQLIGAEKALFRALKTKSKTPKYGIIYHAELVAKMGAKNKGKMARMLAAKAALAARVDALGEDAEIPIADELKARLNKAVHYWDVAKSLNRGFHQRKQPAPYVPSGQAPQPGYSAQMDSSVGVKRKIEEEDQQPKKKRKTETNGAVKEEVKEEAMEVEDTETPKKKKKKSKDKSRDKEEDEVKEEVVEEPTSEKKKKKKKNKDKSLGEEEAVQEAEEQEDAPVEKKKKKKKSKKDDE